ncbi:MAG: hypothetical protein VXW65_10580, partial [Pseudomonadota bacterium]|nr:hypothetical protein [Pseudomonadota bacterium]
MNQHGWGGALGVVLLLVCGTPNIAFARTTIDQKTLLSLPIQELQRQGAAALHAGDPAQAIKIFSELAARQPRDAASQTLLAFSYHLTSQTNPEAVDLALAGYDLAARAESGQFWPLALAGYAAYEQGRYDESLSYLARGLLVRPTDQQAMAVLAAAAYMSGDAGLASVA